ncbi:MAG: magnesium transporter CorA family protein [Patescibacteria group bacterium]
MITTIKYGNITWVNLESPSVKEVSDVADKYPVHSLVAEELTSLTMRSKVDFYTNNLYLVLHFPTPFKTSEINSGCEIDFVVGKDFLITSHYYNFPAFEKLLKNTKRNVEFREKHFQEHAGFLAFQILKELYASSLRDLDKISLRINRVENDIFRGREKENVKDISLLKRDILDFRRTFSPHNDILTSFYEAGANFFGKDFAHYLNLLQGEYAKIKNIVENNKETLETLHETNESLLSTKTNEIMKVLTIMAFITFPLMLLSSIFGMNTIATPIIGRRFDFWIITAIMVLATFGMFLFFKHKKWL